MLELTLPPTEPAASTWQWPASSRVPEHIRRQIEAEATAPQRQRADELGELRSQVAELGAELAALRRELTAERANRRRLHARVFGDEIGKLRAAGIRVPENAKDSDKVYGLAGAVDALQDIILGPCEELPKSKDELANFTPNIERMIRATARTKEIGERIDDLDRRVGAGMRFKGVHEAGVTYDPGDVCVRSGSSWIALTRNADVPGEGATGWSMVAKRGRDSRDRVRQEPTIA